MSVVTRFFLSRLPIYFSLLIFLSVALYFVYQTHLHDGFASAAWFGQLGDFAGGILGALGVVLVVLALHLQQETLKEQRRGQAFMHAFEALKYITPDLESMARRLVTKSRLVVAGGALEEYEARFQSGERNIYFVRVLTGKLQLKQFLTAGGNLADIESAKRVINRYCEEFAVVAGLIEGANKEHRETILNAILKTSPGRVFVELNSLRSICAG
jgi:hypothetical protein